MTIFQGSYLWMICNIEVLEVEDGEKRSGGMGGQVLFGVSVSVPA